MCLFGDVNCLNYTNSSISFSQNKNTSFLFEDTVGSLGVHSCYSSRRIVEMHCTSHMVAMSSVPKMKSQPSWCFHTHVLSWTDLLKNTKRFRPVVLFMLLQSWSQPQMVQCVQPLCTWTARWHLWNMISHNIVVVGFHLLLWSGYRIVLFMVT